MKLSLSIQEDNRIEGGTMRTWFDLETHSGSQHVIDLEESIERISNEGLEQSPSFSSTAPITSIGGTHNLEVSVLFDPIISSSVKKNLLFHAAESYPHLDGRERNPFNQGTGSVICAQLFTWHWVSEISVLSNFKICVGLFFRIRKVFRWHCH